MNSQARRAGRGFGSRWSPGGLVPVLLIVVALGLRLALVALRRWPDVSSDEATIGLAALHIFRDRAHPAFFYGQNYMGTIEAYVGAALFKLLHVSPVVLRVAVLGMVGGFMASTYWLAKALHDTRVARLTLVLLIGGSGPILYHQIVAIGGYQEILLFGSICTLVATRLVLGRAEWPKPPTLTRHLLFAAWGLSAGLGLWSHVLVAPFVVASGLLLVAFCRRELSPLAPSLWLAVLGLALGLAPVVSPNLAALRDGRPTTLDAMLGAAPTPAPGTAPPSPTERVMATAADTLPHWTGVNVTCARARDVLSRAETGGGRNGICRSAGAFVIWVALALLAAATVRLVRDVWSKLFATPGPGQAEVRAEGERRACELALVTAAWGTLAVYSLSRAPGVDPTSTVRYLTGLLIAMPALAAALLPARGDPVKRPTADPSGGWWRRLARGVLRARRYWALGLVLLVLSVGTGDAYFRLSSDVRGVNDEAKAVVDAVVARGVRSIFTDYETCNRSAFLSREGIVCAVLGDDLSSGFDRYGPYRRRVEADPDAAYVFYANSPQGRELTRRIAALDGQVKPPSDATVPAVGQVGGYLIVPRSLVGSSPGGPAS